MLYDIGFAIFSLFYLPALIFGGKLHGDFAERFGRYGEDKRKALAEAKGAIWIQAVSVGEVALCRGLIPKLKSAFPARRIVLSTITKTGNDLAKRLFSEDAVIIYFPLDFSSIVKKVVALITPGIYIMIETEIWPNLLKEIARNKVPSILINGRISDRSFGKYGMAKPFLKDTLKKISQFCMQSDLDAERIIYLGAPIKRVRVTGNMKFDIDIKADSKAMETLRETLSLKAGEELFVAGSTHRAEERMVIESFKELLKDFPKIRLLIAPRHIERGHEVRQEVKRAGLAPSQVFILDRIGYLASAYSFATLVFIGGSLVKHGGQNPIEPAAFEKAVIFGPHMFNFKSVARVFLDCDGAIQVSDKEGLVRAAALLLKDSRRRAELGRNAKRVALENRGATEKNLEEVSASLRGCPEPPGFGAPEAI